jgi:hypothetical protein
MSDERRSPGQVAGIVAFVVFVIVPILAVVTGSLLWLALSIWTAALSLL